MADFFFSGWSSVWRVMVVGVCAYATLVFFLRIAGNRTLAKMNVFDLVVTVSLGSTLASVLISKDISWADGATAFAVLITMQFMVTWTSVRVPWIRKLVTGEPVLLLYRGTFLSSALRRARVVEDEVRAALRSAGLASLEEAEAVVLETDGSLTVVHKDHTEGRSTLQGVLGVSSTIATPHAT